MKATSKTKEEESNKEIEFPILMQSTQSDLVVLFYSEKQGTIVRESQLNQLLAEPKSNWMSCFNKDVWKVFPGEIILKNE